MVGLMAKKKIEPIGDNPAPEKPPAKKTGPKPAEGVGRTAATMIRSTPDWKKWLDELADFNRGTVSDTVDRALVELARNIGFPKVPPRR